MVPAQDPALNWRRQEQPGRGRVATRQWLPRSPEQAEGVWADHGQAAAPAESGWGVSQGSEAGVSAQTLYKAHSSTSPPHRIPPGHPSILGSWLPRPSSTNIVFA